MTDERFAKEGGAALREILAKSEAVRGLSALTEKGMALVHGADGSVKTWITAALAENKPVVVIVPDRKTALRWEADLQFFLPEMPQLSFPVVEEADFAVTFTGTEALRGRMQALSALLEERPAVILATAVEAAQKLPLPRTLMAGEKAVGLGDSLSRETFLAELVAMGYERVDQVERCGHFAVRGDIIDIFSINEEHPFRLEFWDDEVDDIRLFNEDDQRSVRKLSRAVIFPMTAAGEAKASLASYAGRSLFIYDEPQRGEEALRKFLGEEKENKKKCVPWEEVLSAAHAVIFSALARSFPTLRPAGALSWKGETVTNFQHQLPLFLDEISYRLREGWAAAVVCSKPSEKEEILSAFHERGISVLSAPAAGGAAFTEGVLSQGFEYPEAHLAVYAAGDILGRPKLRRRFRKERGERIRFFSELTEGDYVVQSVHGIGRYMGLRTIELEGIHKDYITIQYAGGDKLYLPMEQIATLEKYIGPEGEAPSLSKMGGAAWEKTRSRAQKSIADLAEKLLAVYAEREMAEGIAFSPDTEEQREFEDSFPYVETPDQMDAIEAVKRAMERPEPMDMLVCGDVGFGKTEVAMRAVVKCVMSGYQSIVLVPTTVLSQQHYQTFTERMTRLGITVAVLNRFATAKERRDILRRMAAGTLDVLIGTHAVLAKQIETARLGLLVVDEEQRFGVVQKEKWKSRNHAIDILTLSATPIPRTLHMSLTGVRDMVTISNPPSNRHAIQTYVTEYDDEIAREAILREKERGGQVYFIYNRIDSIDAMAAHLKNLLPEDVTIGIAHGRMPGDLLEDVIYDFFEGKYDVLLCTTLIENGVDQPNANTMLVYDADRMGLSQLYQMRGRVGRSDKIARAYFFYRRGKVLSEVAEKRLSSIREFTELGAGFKIAMRDLEIRGAGNLLGAAQHGNIESVGFAAYCTMLDEAIRKLKAAREGKPLPKKLPNTLIEFIQDAYIDDRYIRKAEQKIEIYRRMAGISSEKELEDLIDEVVDRFGTPPAPVEKLFAALRLKIEARTLGIGSIVSDGPNFLLTWADAELADGWNVMAMPAAYLAKLRILPQAPLRVTIKKAAVPGDPVRWLTELLRAVHKNIAENKK